MFIAVVFFFDLGCMLVNWGRLLILLWWAALLSTASISTWFWSLLFARDDTAMPSGINARLCQAFLVLCLCCRWLGGGLLPMGDGQRVVYGWWRHHIGDVSPLRTNACWQVRWCKTRFLRFIATCCYKLKFHGTIFPRVGWLWSHSATKIGNRHITG